MEPARHRPITGGVQPHPAAGVIAVVYVLGPFGGGSRYRRGDGGERLLLDGGMTPHETRSAPREWLVRGYQRAYARFNEIQNRETPDKMFLPLFEALSWAGSLEEKLRPHKEP